MRPLHYISTRTRPDGGYDDPVGIETAIARGMPPDGGLYVPEYLPRLPARAFDPEPLEYPELARLVLEPFFPDWGESLSCILDASYGNAKAGKFDTPEIAPLVKLGGFGSGSYYLLELFHGKTCAFKDMALSVLGGLLRESLDRLGRKEPVLVLTATSGDTGSAALEGLADTDGIYTAVFYPAEGTSEIQRLQMTTARGERCFVRGVRGNFDEAQGAVKRAFGRASLGQGPLAEFSISSANSINIGRLLPQIAYYVAAWRALVARGDLPPGGTMDVVVPTGNFGDILAAKYAKEMGLPIGTLVCASNSNKVLADFFATGVYDRRRLLEKTDSPSMDILVSSNLERLLFMASGGDPGRVASLMSDLAANGWFAISRGEREWISDFSSGWCSDFAARSVVAEVWKSSGILIDPHTATAVETATRLFGAESRNVPVVIAATASPFKFPRVCLEALGDIGIGGSKTKGADGGDLGLALSLAERTGLLPPAPIRELAGRKIMHDRICEISEVEEESGKFARSMRGTRI